MTDTTTGPCQIQNDNLRISLSSRFDITIKYAYAKEYLHGDSLAFAEARILYRAHINKRTSGIEPLDPYSKTKQQPKTSIDEYEQDYKRLIKDLLTNGYSKESPVPIGKNGLPLNGAHRIAASLALGLAPYTKLIEKDGYSWSYKDILGNNSIQNAYSKKLAKYWCELNRDHFSTLIIWAPATRYLDTVYRVIAKKGLIVGYVYNYRAKSYAELLHAVRSVYAYCSSSTEMLYADLKAQRLRPHGRGFTIIMLSSSGEKCNISATLDARDNIREQLALHISREQYITCHAVDSCEEAQYIADVFSSDCLSLSRKRPSERMVCWLDNSRVFLEERQISRSQVCVVGSSVLDLHGIRQSTDIDITITPGLRSVYGKGITHLTEYLDIVTEGYHRKMRLGQYGVSDGDLIKMDKFHEWWLGFKFAKPWIIFDRKLAHRRRKDIKDVFLQAPSQVLLLTGLALKTANRWLFVLLSNQIIGWQDKRSKVANKAKYFIPRLRTKFRAIKICFRC